MRREAPGAARSSARVTFVLRTTRILAPAAAFAEISGGDVREVVDVEAERAEFLEEPVDELVRDDQAHGGREHTLPGKMGGSPPYTRGPACPRRDLPARAWSSSSPRSPSEQGDLDERETQLDGAPIPPDTLRDPRSHESFVRLRTAPAPLHGSVVEDIQDAQLNLMVDLVCLEHAADEVDATNPSAAAWLRQRGSDLADVRIALSDILADPGASLLLTEHAPLGIYVRGLYVYCTNVVSALADYASARVPGGGRPPVTRGAGSMRRPGPFSTPSPAMSTPTSSRSKSSGRAIPPRSKSSRPESTSCSGVRVWFERVFAAPDATCDAQGAVKAASPSADRSRLRCRLASRSNSGTGPVPCGTNAVLDGTSRVLCLISMLVHRKEPAPRGTDDLRLEEHGRA